MGVSAFIATNIDDIFLLMMFFSSSYSSIMTFPVRQIVFGQYLGIGLLIAISALGSLIALVVPPYVIGLLGIVPIAIGAKRLVQVIKGDDKNSSPSLHRAQESTNRRNKHYLPCLAVAAVTFSNGGDNIGGLYSNVCTIQLCKSSYYTNSSFHGNDCSLVCGSIPTCKSSAGRFENTSHHTCSHAICAHRTWDIHSGAGISNFVSLGSLC